MRKFKIFSFIALIACAFLFMLGGLKSNAAIDYNSYYSNIFNPNVSSYEDLPFMIETDTSGVIHFSGSLNSTAPRKRYIFDVYHDGPNIPEGDYLIRFDGFPVEYAGGIDSYFYIDIESIKIGLNIGSVVKLHLPEFNTVYLSFDCTDIDFDILDFSCNFTVLIVPSNSTTDSLQSYLGWVPHYDYKTYDNNITVKKDETINSLEQQVQQLTEEKNELSSTVASKDESISTLNSTIYEKEKMISSLQQQLTEEKNELNSIISSKNEVITDLNHFISEKNKSIESLNASIAEKEKKIKELEQEILSLKEVEVDKTDPLEKNEKTNYFEEHKTAIIVSSVSAGILILVIAAGIIWIIKRK